MTNRDLAINYLRLYWWNQTPMSSLGLLDFPAAREHYDKLSPTFLDSIGGVVKGIPQDQVRVAWTKVAKEYGTKYPPIGAFYDGLASEVRTPTASQVAQAAGDGVKQATGVLTLGLGGMALLAGVGIAIYFALQGGGLKKIARA